ncbi:hypothetical protein GCM10027430_10210 [Lysobacter tyrosinilyticus]
MTLSAPLQAQSCAVGETPAAFGFTGGEQTMTVPAGVNSLTVYLSGAQGGAGRSGAGTIGGSPNSPGGTGGLGGRVRGTLAVTPGATLSIWVGGQASQAVNPGGIGQGVDGIGGGATDIRVGGNGIGNRVGIAGGGGGGGNAGWSTANVIAGGAGGVGGGGTGGAGANVPGGPGPFGGGGGAVGTGGAGGGGCGSFPATAGNAANGDGGDSFNFSGSFSGAGFGGGGGGGATVGAGGGGAGVGTTACQQNWNGGGGGGAGGSSGATGLTAVTINNGVQAGNGAALICFAAPTFSVGGNASGQTGNVTLQLDATNPTSTQQVVVAAGATSFAFASELPAGANWNISVITAPSGQLCSVNPPSGTAIAADATVALTCTTVTVGITPANLPAATYNAAYSQTLTASSGNGGTAPYTFSIASGALPGGMTLSAAGTLSGTPTAAGSFNFTVTATSANGFAGNQAYTFAVGQAGQTITGFAANPTAPVFAPNGTFSVSATGGGSGNPVVFGSGTPSVCTVSGSTVTMLSAGTCSLTADQAGNANYTAAPQVALQVEISPASQTIANFIATPSSPVYAPNGTFNVSATGGPSSSPVVFGSTTTSVCTVSDNTVTMLSAGTCSLTADQAGDASYSAAPQAVLDVTIAAATQAITGFAANPGAPVYSANGTFALSATGGASGNPVIFATTTPTVCSISGNTATIGSIGTCTVTANQAGSTNYSAAPQVSLNVTIAAATPQLAWLVPLQKTLGEASFNLPPPASNSAGAFTYASSNPSVATVSGSTVTIVGAGATTLTATQAAAGNYTAGSITTTLTVAARPDPTRDPGVVGGLQAQIDASVRFATAQQSNIRDRLRQLRSANGDNPSHNGLTFNMSGARGQSLSLPVMGNALDNGTAPRGWGVWTAGAVTMGERDGNANSDGFDFRSDGVSVGIDRRVGHDAVVGLAGGFGWNDTDFDEHRSDLDADQRSLSAYGLWRGGEHVFVDGLMGWGRLDFDIARWSELAGATATAKREGEQRFASLSLGYEQRNARSALTGYGRLDVTRTTLDAYRETGLGIYDLMYREQTIESTSAAFGIEGSYARNWGARAFRPFWSIEYRDALRNDGDAAINYVVQPVASDYALAMRTYNSNTFVLGGGFDVELAAGWQLSMLYRREQASDLDGDTFALRLSFGGANGPQQAGPATTPAP